MNRFLYTCLIYLATPFILLYLSYRALNSSDYRGRIAERFGFKSLPRSKPVILVHSVSVGETIAAIPLINNLIEKYPNHQVLVTTSTPTGSAMVLKSFSDKVLHCYLPIDLPGAVKRFLNAAKPQVCIIMETELWPNLIHQLNLRNIPTLLANARMSEKSAKSYLGKAAPLMREMLSKLTLVSAQFDSDAQRFLTLGLHPEQLQIGGSIKFELTIADELLNKQRELRQAWAPQRPVWVAGSTHPGEHEQILQTHRALLKLFPQLLLIIAPRHCERFDEVAQLCQQQGFEYVRRSDGVTPSPSTQIMVADSMGELLLLFGVADVAYVGGSLIERGGHNPLEPAALGKPVIMGTSVYNFSDISQRLIEAGGLQLVDDQQHLTQLVIDLLNNEQQRQTMGDNARSVVQQNQGTLKRLLSWVELHLKSSE